MVPGCDSSSGQKPVFQRRRSRIRGDLPHQHLPIHPAHALDQIRFLPPAHLDGLARFEDQVAAFAFDVGLHVVHVDDVLFVHPDEIEAQERVLEGFDRLAGGDAFARIEPEVGVIVLRFEADDLAEPHEMHAVQARDADLFKGVGAVRAMFSVAALRGAAWCSGFYGPGGYGSRRGAGFRLMGFST